jgi:hypothetical protein
MKNAQRAKVVNHPIEQINQFCREAISKLKHDGIKVIRSTDVAHWVARKLDPSKRTSASMYIAALHGLAQLARPILREGFDLPENPDDKQIEMYANELQDRYSIKRPGEDGTMEEGYCLRTEITKEEIETQVIPMLEKRRDAYQKHLDMLRAWNESR